MGCGGFAVQTARVCGEAFSHTCQMPRAEGRSRGMLKDRIDSMEKQVGFVSSATWNPIESVRLGPSMRSPSLIFAIQ